MAEGTSGTFAQSPSATAFSTLYARVKNYVQSPDDSDATTIAKEGINEAILRLNTRRWTWARVKADVTLAAGTQEYALQTNFKAPRSAQLLDAAGEVSSMLDYLDPISLDAVVGGRTSQGDPAQYTVYNEFDNGKLTLSVNPSSGFVAQYPTLRLRYYRRLDVLSADANTFAGPTEVEPFIVWYARASVAAHWRPDAVPFAEKRAAELWQALVRDDVVKETGDW